MYARLARTTLSLVEFKQMKDRNSEDNKNTGEPDSNEELSACVTKSEYTKVGTGS